MWDGAVESLRVAADVSGSSPPPAGELSWGGMAESLKFLNHRWNGFF